MLDKLWEYGVETTKYTHYQICFDCKYWHMLGSLNKWSIIKFTNKTTSSESFNEVHKLVLYGISENIPSLLQLRKYGATNIED